MKVRELRELLEEFERWHSDYRLQAEASVLRDVAVFLKEHERASLSKLVAAIRTSRVPNL